MIFHHTADHHVTHEDRVIRTVLKYMIQSGHIYDRAGISGSSLLEVIVSVKHILTLLPAVFKIDRKLRDA